MTNQWTIQGSIVRKNGAMVCEAANDFLQCLADYLEDVSKTFKRHGNVTLAAKADRFIMAIKQKEGNEK